VIYLSIGGGDLLEPRRRGGFKYVHFGRCVRYADVRVQAVLDPAPWRRCQLVPAV